MARSGALKHIHKYYKNTSGFWACARPDCTHYLPTNVADRIEFSKSICWECEEVFQMNKTLAELSQPKCQPCRMPNSTSIEEFIRQRDLKIKAEENRITVKVERDGKGNRLLYDDKGNVTIEPIVSDSGLIIDEE